MGFAAANFELFSTGFNSIQNYQLHGVQLVYKKPAKVII